MSNFDAKQAARWMKEHREGLGWSTGRLAEAAKAIALSQGDEIGLTQQSISNFEQGTSKRRPPWFRYVEEAFSAARDGTEFDPYLSMGKSDAGILIKLLPTHVGMGGGGTADGDIGQVSFSKDLIENELRAPPDALLAMIAEGNSMEPQFLGGDQILVDTRRRSLAQPGAFCLWDGDGHVIKYIEKVHGSEPAMVRVSSSNPIYEPRNCLADEIKIVGKVVWFGRRVF